MALASTTRSSLLRSWRRAARNGVPSGPVLGQESLARGRHRHPGDPAVHGVDLALQQALLLQPGRDARHRWRGDALDRGQFAEGQPPVLGEDQPGQTSGRP